jgi:glucosamine-6-phosphate deaminase
MDEQLFNHIDIPRENINIPDGTLKTEEYEKYCEEYVHFHI